MREIVFRVLLERPGRLEAEADTLPIRIRAASLEELHHEAREALIALLGPVHGTVRVRLRRGVPEAESAIRPVRRAAYPCG